MSLRPRDGIAFLAKDEYLERSPANDGFLSLGGNREDLQSREGLRLDRTSWLKVIVSILNIYGENKIYDFVFRDKEYQETLQSGKSEGIDTSPENATLKFLEGFKEAFEESLGKSDKEIAKGKYIELYFEYVFSQILKREYIND